MTSTVTTGTPFVGPRPFTEYEAEVFFGRSSELSSLVAEVLSTRIVLLYAPSGSGKSSLINAGLVPAVRDEGFEVSQVRVNTATATEDATAGQRLRDAVVAAESIDGPTLLVLDQFEEALVALPRVELSALVDVIYDVTSRSPLARILISFREEYLARIGAMFTRATEAQVGHYHLDRLSKRGAFEAFTGLMDAGGLAVEPEAADLFLERIAPTNGLASEVVFEPLYLQLLGSRLWSSIADAPTSTSPGPGDEGSLRASRPPVTADDVRRLVDFEEAIELFFADTIAEACSTHGVTEKRMRDWIDAELVTPDESRSMVRRDNDQTEGLPTSLLDDLVHRGLLRAEPRGDDLWLELAHDQIVERVREFNRTWWNRRVTVRLRGRDERLSLAMEGAQWDVQRWLTSRTLLWSLATAIRESGLRLSDQLDRVPFAGRRKKAELDRLALRAFVLMGALVNTGMTTYRVLMANRPVTEELEGLDPETAKSRLAATSLNLGRTEQVLVGANVVCAFAWARLLSLDLSGVMVRSERVGRRRKALIAVLLVGDIGLTLLRWAVRAGLIKSCLDESWTLRRTRALARTEPDVVRRSTRLAEVSQWSHERPVLLVLDGRRDIDSHDAFEVFARDEVPVYRHALRARGAMAAWCARDVVRVRGWRKQIAGLGFPARGQRTYYMVEGGCVVAWRTVKAAEFRANARAVLSGAGGSPEDGGRDVKGAVRFRSVIERLVLASEAAPSLWRELGDQYMKASMGRHRRP